MSDLKPIEPGCLCLVTKGGQAGITVTALGFVGRLPDRKDTDYWEVDTLMSFSIGPKEPYRPESWLLRIDGHDEQETETSKRLEMVE